MATNYPTFQSNPRLSSVSASLATINTVTASVISASSYLGTSAGESAVYVGNKTISGSLSVSSSINTLQSITSSYPVLLDGLYFGTGKYDTINSIAIGYAPLASTSTGNDNVAIGYVSAYNTTAGSKNISLGSNSLYSNTTGNNNISIGHTSLYSSKTAANNVAIGYQALYYNISGATNTAIGYNAGVSLGVGPEICSNNTFVGPSAGISVQKVQNCVVIGGNDGNTLENTTGSIIISDGAGNIRIQANNTGLVTIPGTLSVVGGQIKFPATQIASADVNTLDDYEEGTWTPILSSSALFTSTAPVATTLGTYVKIGKKVFVQCTINLTSTGSATGPVWLVGLPFGCHGYQNGIISPTSWYSMNTSLNALFFGYLLSFTTTAQLVKATTGGIASVQTTDFTNTAQLHFNGSYEVS